MDAPLAAFGMEQASWRMRDLLLPIVLVLFSPLLSCTGAALAPCASGFERGADGNCYEWSSQDTGALPVDTDSGSSDSGSSDSGSSDSGGDGADEPDPALLALIEAWADANTYINEGMGYTGCPTARPSCRRTRTP